MDQNNRKRLFARIRYLTLIINISVSLAIVVGIILWMFK